VSKRCTQISVPDVGVTPQIGDTIRLYGKGFGYIVRGIDINDQEIFYRTPDEQCRKYDNEQRLRHATDSAVFQRQSAVYAARIAALPAPFITRIQRFISNEGYDWQVGFEDYELFVCEEAVKIANEFAVYDNPVAVLQRFAAISFDDQRRCLSTLSDQHSGNTIDAALQLAHVYLTDPEAVPRFHGAMCSLVGCDNYGCYAAREGKADV
jgi:hypothetical protein